MVAIRFETNQALIVSKLNYLSVGLHVVFQENFELVPQHKQLGPLCKLLDEINRCIEVQLEDTGGTFIGRSGIEAFVVLEQCLFGRPVLHRLFRLMLKVAVINPDDWMPRLLLRHVDFCPFNRDCCHLIAPITPLIFQYKRSSLFFLDHCLSKAVFELLVEQRAVLGVRSLFVVVGLTAAFVFGLLAIFLLLLLLQQERNKNENSAKTGTQLAAYVRQTVLLIDKSQLGCKVDNK